MESRQGQDLANDGLQMAAVRKARWHASTVRLRCGADPLRWCPCGCLIFISATRKDERFGDELLLAWRALDFRLWRAFLPPIFPHAYLVERSTMLFRFGRQVRSNPATDTPNSLSLFPGNEVIGNFRLHSMRY
jgi:hypothetical protein